MEPNLPNGVTSSNPHPNQVATAAPRAPALSMKDRRLVDTLRYGEAYFAVELFGPREAEEALRHAAPNRRSSMARVKALAEEMKDGRWQVGGNMLAFNKEGQLIDGEHRMRAVVESGATVPFLVMRNADHSIRAVIDTNRSRSAADLLKLVGGFDNGSKLSASIRVFDWLLAGGPNSQYMAYRQIEELAETYIDSLKWALKMAGSHRHLANGPVLAALAFAYPTDPEGLTRFAKKVGDGVGLAEGEPALVLRNALLNLEAPRVDNTARYEIALKVLRAAQAHLEGKKLEAIRTSETARLYFRRAYDLA